MARSNVRTAGQLSDAHMDRQVSATGRVISLLGIRDRIHITLDLPKGAEVEIHPKDES